MVYLRIGNIDYRIIGEYVNWKDLQISELLFLEFQQHKYLVQILSTTCFDLISLSSSGGTHA